MQNFMKQFNPPEEIEIKLMGRHFKDTYYNMSDTQCAIDKALTEYIAENLYGGQGLTRAKAGVFGVEFYGLLGMLEYDITSYDQETDNPNKGYDINHFKDDKQAAMLADYESDRFIRRIRLSNPVWQQRGHWTQNEEVKEEIIKASKPTHEPTTV